MYLLQEAIIGGYILLALIVVAFLIIVPIIFYLLKNTNDASTDNRTEITTETLIPDMKKTDELSPAFRLMIAIVFSLILIFLLITILGYFLPAYS